MPVELIVVLFPKSIKLSYQTMSDVIQSRRGRPPRISRERVVDAAIEIGLDRFSMDDIADRLEVTTPALYTHVAGRDEIVRLGASLLIGRSAAGTGDWDDWEGWLRAWAANLRRDLGAVGGELLDAISEGLDMSSLDFVDQGLALMLEAGFGVGDSGHALWLAARVAFSAGPSGTSAVATVAEVAQATARERSSPALAAAMDAVRDVDNDEAFAFDLDVVIAGLRVHCLS